MYWVQSDNRIHTLIIFMRQFDRNLRSIYLRANIDHPSIVLEGATNYLVSIFIKSGKIHVAVDIYVFGSHKFFSLLLNKGEIERGFLIQEPHPTLSLLRRGLFNSLIILLITPSILTFISLFQKRTTLISNTDKYNLTAQYHILYL